MNTSSQKWKKNKFTTIYVVLGLFVVLYIILNMSSEDSSKNIDKDLREEVAQVLNIKGIATSTYNNKIKDIKSSHSIHVNDLIQLDNQSQANLYFNNDFEVTFFGPASFVFEKTKDALYLILKKGDFKLIKSNSNSFFIIKDFKTYLLKDYLNNKNSKANLNKLVSNKTLIISGDKPQQETPELDTNSPSFNDLLDNEIIKQRKTIQKCQLNRVQDAGMISGKVLVGIGILPNGKVDDTLILQSEIKDEKLLLCLKTTFQRIRFTAFKGEKIYRSYPVSFE